MAGFASAATYWKHANLHALRANRFHDRAGNSGAPMVSAEPGGGLPRAFGPALTRALPGDERAKRPPRREVAVARLHQERGLVDATAHRGAHRRVARPLVGDALLAEERRAYVAGRASGKRPIQGGKQRVVVVRRPDPARRFPNARARCAFTSAMRVIRA